MRKKRYTTDAIEIMERLFYEGHPERKMALWEEEINVEVSVQVYQLREVVGLTQKQFAKLVGTTASVIDQLEESDYEGNSLTMLQEIAEALGKEWR